MSTKENLINSKKKKKNSEENIMLTSVLKDDDCVCYFSVKNEVTNNTNLHQLPSQKMRLNVALRRGQQMAPRI